MERISASLKGRSLHMAHISARAGQAMSDHQMHVTCLKLSQNTFRILIQASREEMETKNKKKTQYKTKKLM